MPRINLLPWREGQRKERKLAFLVALGVAVIAAIVTTFAAYLMFDSMISGQERRNQMLRMKEETRVLDWATPSNLRRLLAPALTCVTPVR